MDREEEEEPAERTVDRERGEVRAGEPQTAEDREGKHRVTLAHLDHREAGEANDGQHNGTSDHPRVPAARRELDKGVGEPREPQGAEPSAGDVRVPALPRRGGRLRDVPVGDGDDDGSDRQVDEEDRAPTDAPDEPATNEGTYRCGYPAEARPRTYGSSSVFGAERRLDDREARRCQQRAADALDGTRPYERRAVRREPAGERSEREEHRAHDEDAAAAVQVSERAAEQDKSRQRDEIPVDDPLQAREAHVEIGTELRECDVDDRRIEHRDRRPAYCCGEHPPSGGRLVANGRLRVGHRTSSSDG
jgi:hypothetical protein